VKWEITIRYLKLQSAKACVREPGPPAAMVL
jgi:hypothetical protein